MKLVEKNLEFNQTLMKYNETSKSNNWGHFGN